MGAFSRQSLTYVRLKGCNALGVIEFAVCLLPLLVSTALDAGASGPPQGIGRVERMMLPIIASAVAAFDLWWRWREEPDPRWWVKAFSADAGGALVFVPTWLFWVAMSAMGIFILIAVPYQPSPYSSPPAQRSPRPATRESARGGTIDDRREELAALIARTRGKPF